MKIPKKIKVGALTYTIEITAEIPSSKMGETHLDTLHIKIRSGKPDSEFNTFLHELFHAFNTERGDEVMIQSFADSLHLFIKDNPEVFR